MWIKAGLDEGVAKLLEVKVEGPKKMTKVSMTPSQAKWNAFR